VVHLPSRSGFTEIERRSHLSGDEGDGRPGVAARPLFRLAIGISWRLGPPCLGSVNQVDDERGFYLLPNTLDDFGVARGFALPSVEKAIRPEMENYHPGRDQGHCRRISREYRLSINNRIGLTQR
jgi:hypothetical protein